MIIIAHYDVESASARCIITIIDLYIDNVMSIQLLFRVIIDLYLDVHWQSPLQNLRDGQGSGHDPDSAVDFSFT